MTAVAFLLLVCVALPTMCCMAIVFDSARIELHRKFVIEPVYRQKLGIGATDKEVVAFLKKELQGLSHKDAVAKLENWGDVQIEYCSSEAPDDGMCVLTISNFLETGTNYRFSVFYENSVVDDIAIDYS